MQPIFAYAAVREAAHEWQQAFAKKAPAIDFQIWPEIVDLHRVRYLLAWEALPDVATTFPNLEVLFSLGAGVDQFDRRELPPELKLVRMIEPGITAGMVQYVCMAVLALHRNLPTYIAQQRRGQWKEFGFPPACERRVGILGTGVLAQASMQSLKVFEFPLSTWSRSRRTVENVCCYAGLEELSDFLSKVDILVCLLPLTVDTHQFLNAEMLSRLPCGASLVHVGRGQQLDLTALMHLLDTEHLSGAVLDVTDPEPLPPGHPCWEHPGIIITPHIASITQPQTAVDSILSNLKRLHNGEPMLGLVDRTLGY